ncbi:MAG: tetratricopeptide repeat protein [Gammaproteobacteria bacterium]
MIVPLPQSARIFRVAAGPLLYTLTLLLLSACGADGEPDELFRAGEYERAYKIFRERVAEGDVNAVNFLGIHFYLGAGVERDYERAVKFFELAALENDANAQRNLGIMYMRGLGVPQDNHRAYAWFFQAYSGGGNQNARKYLQMLSDNVTPNAGGRAREWVAEQLRMHSEKKADLQQALSF